MIKWNKTSEWTPPINTVFIGCRRKGSIFTIPESYKLSDCFPMIRLDNGYRYAVQYYPVTTEPEYWTIDINLPEYKQEI